MKQIKTKKFFISILFGFLFTFISKNIGIKCTISDTGGIIEGGGGFPIKFYYCGVWGEDYIIMLFVLNVILWSLFFYFITKFFKK